MVFCGARRHGFCCCFVVVLLLLLLSFSANIPGFSSSQSATGFKKYSKLQNKCDFIRVKIDDVIFDHDPSGEKMASSPIMTTGVKMTSFLTATIAVKIT